MTNQEAATLLVKEYGHYRDSVPVGVNASLPEAIAMAIAALSKEDNKEDK